MRRSYRYRLCGVTHIFEVAGRATHNCIMFEWVTELRAALARELEGAPAVMIVATVDPGGAPHARSLVCRRIENDGRLFAVMDDRSSKVAHIAANRRSEAVFWLPRTRIQYRITADATIVRYLADDTLRREIWRELSDAARALFFWPTPGIAPSSDDAFAEAVSADVQPPRNFDVLILEPKQVDRLALDTHPHRRRVWRMDTHWHGVDLNP
jgi:PPOX class probable FMN-dependent enzyme